MKELWIKAALGATALVCAGVANAFVIDFDSGVGMTYAPDTPLLSNGDFVTQGGYAIIGQDVTDTDGTLVGAMVNGASSNSCLDGACPTGNATNYITSYNDGLVSVQTFSGNTFTGGNLVLSSFSAAFLPASGASYSSGQVGIMAVEADRADGSYAVAYYALAGPNAATGQTTFANFTNTSYYSSAGTGTITSGNITALYFYAYYCSGTGCSAFSSDKGDFALDNIAINVAAVPEPAEWLLMALGLAGVGAVVRRRNAV